MNARSTRIHDTRVHPAVRGGEPAQSSPLGQCRPAAYLFLLAVLAVAAPGGAQPVAVELVADLGPAPGRPGFTFPHAPTRIGNQILFLASDEVASNQLWATDGTTAGTRRVRDLGPGIAAGHVFGLVSARDRAFLQTDDLLAGTRLWVTDGSRAGTVPIFSAGTYEERRRPFDPVLRTAAIGRNLLFLRAPAEDRLEVWRSDGTEAGTRLLASPATGTAGPPTLLVGAAGRVYFMFRGLDQEEELWTSDGTSAGTRRLASFQPFPIPGYSPPAPIAVGGRLFFVAFGTNSGFELWTSDGTSAGTRLVRDLVPGRGGSFIGFLTAGGDEAFFSIGRPEGPRLWRSDGTERGTVPLPMPAGLGLQDVAAFGRELLFAQDGAFWLTRGDRPPLRLSDRLFPCGSAARQGGRLYFAANDGPHGCELWRTDGTPEGTALAFDFIPGEASSNPEPNALPRDLLLIFSNLQEIWVTQGDRAQPLRRPRVEIRSGAPAYLTPLGSGLVFGANGSLRRALWRTDGTAAGTVAIESGPAWFFGPTFPRDLIPLGLRLAFRAPEGIEIWDGSEDPGARPILLSSDGFSASLDDRTLFLLGQRAYWLTLSPPVQFPAVRQVELWSTDGTAAGTARVRSLFPAPVSIFGAVYYVPDFFAVAGESALAFFFPYDGSELWTTDGTEEGTGKIFDLDEADDEASGRFFAAGVPFAERILFTTWGPQTGIQIWQTDATPAGAYLVGRVDVDSPPRYLTRSGDLAYFSAGDGAGRELWVTDGTPFGARRVKDIAPGRASSSPLELTSVGDRLFFTADDGAHGRELWSTDGTAEGTAMVADIAPGRATSFPQQLAAIGADAARLAFSADDGVHGLEPWTAQADGAGAIFLADVAPGDASSSPAEFTSVGEALYFAAGTRRTGRELWKATIPP